MQTVKNITSIKYFLDRFDTVDPEYSFDIKYHPRAPKTHFNSLPTFIAEFNNCSVHTLPLLVTEDDHLITDHVWPLLHKYKHKPQKIHRLWDTWGETINLKLPPITKQFDEAYVYVWLPIDEKSANNPWHIWIDVISKFRLLEKRGVTDFSKFIYILSTPSAYFNKVANEVFPDLKYYVMSKNDVWRFKHLLVPSMSNHNDGVTTLHLAPWLRHFKGLFGYKTLRPNRKIFISRENAKTRKLINADELLMAIKGWEIIKLEEMNIKDQFKTFAEATHVLATHGAGLVNLLWCNEGTKVIEIQDTKMLHKKVYPLLSHNLGLKHELYLAKTVPVNTKGREKPPGVKRLSDLINFKIDVQKLIRHLD
jgi:hypothetical protein